MTASPPAMASAPATEPTRSRHRERVHVGMALAATALGFVALHLLTARNMTGPVLYEDGVAYLANARYLSGRAVVPQMAATALYHAGYSLFLVPLYLVFDDPLHVYRGALVVNALLASAAIVPLYALARGPFALSHRRALVAAICVLAYPATLLQSNYLWSENLLLPLVATWALLGFRVARDRTLPGALAFAAVGAATYLTHPRGLVIVACTIGYLGLLAVRRHLAVVAAAASLAALGVLLGATQVLHAHLREAIWILPGTGRTGNLIRTALDVTAWPEIALRATGQTWYLVAASAGLWVVGVLAVALLVRGRRPGGDDPVSGAERWGAGLLLAAGGGMLVLSSVFMVRGTRVDHLVYGRYNEALLPIFLLAGVALLLNRTPRAIPAGAAGAAVVLLAATAAVLRYGRGVEEFTGDVMMLNVLGVLVYDPDPSRLAVGTISLLALVPIVAISAAGWRFPVAAVMAVTVFFAASALRVEQEATGPFSAFWSGLLTIHEVAADLPPGEPIAYDRAALQIWAFNGYQFWLDDRAFVLFDSRRQDPASRVVIASRDWPAAASLGASMLASEDHVDQALWLLPP